MASPFLFGLLRKLPRSPLKVAAPAAPITLVCKVVMNSKSERILTELLIARAFLKLSSIPAEGSQLTVTLASVGNCEIRMFLAEQAADFDGVSLFWLELLDHGANMSVDSFRCITIKDAAPAFEELMSQAICLNNPDGTE
jgi:hypothetical protein